MSSSDRPIHFHPNFIVLILYVLFAESLGHGCTRRHDQLYWVFTFTVLGKRRARLFTLCNSAELSLTQQLFGSLFFLVFVISKNWFSSFEFEEKGIVICEVKNVDTYSDGRVVIGRYNSVREWVRWHDNVKMVSRLTEFRFSECPQKTSQCLFF